VSLVAAAIFDGPPGEKPTLHQVFVQHGFSRNTPNGSQKSFGSSRTLAWVISLSTTAADFKASGNRRPDSSTFLLQKQFMNAKPPRPEIPLLAGVITLPTALPLRRPKAVVHVEAMLE